MLRHKFPFRQLPDLRRESEPTSVPPVMRAPHEVEFRPNTDLEEVVSAVTKFTRLRVTAAVGAGKSTNFPRLLSEKMGMVVVHAVPSHLLAVDIYDYLSKRHPGKYALVLEKGDPFPESGVVLTTYPWLVGQYLSTVQGALPYGECVLYADEVHESDCYVEVIRNLGGKIPGVKCFVESSATHSPDRMPKREAKGKVETRMFPKENPETWQPADVKKPWSATASGGNVLVFMDDKSTALSLVGRYVACGVEAYRLHSRMGVEEFRAAMKALRDPGGGIVVLVADYTFRNGFTFDVSRIIDSGLVKYYVYVDGAVKSKYRVMYELEKYQSMARGGRTSGSECVYYFPAQLDCEPKLCSLEGVECEGAALLFRLCGYAPPVPVQEFTLSRQGPVPLDLYDALNGAVPLVALPPDKVQPLVVAPSTGVDSVVEEVVDTYGFPSSPVEEIGDLFADMRMDVRENRLVVGNSDFLGQLQEMSSSARSLLFGHFYACAEARDTGEFRDRNWERLSQTILSKPHLVNGYTHAMRSTAVAKLLDEYNKALVFCAAVDRIGAHGPQLNAVSLKYPEQVRVWSGWLDERNEFHRLKAVSLLKALELLRDSSMNFKVVESQGKVEQQQARMLMEPLMTAVSAVTAEVDADQFFGQLESGLGLEEEGPEFVHSVSAPRKIRMRSKPVTVLGMTKHNFYVESTVLGLSLQDYADAIIALMHEKGIVASSVHKLELDAPGVEPSKVMQAVRDGLGGAPKRVAYSVKRLSQF